MILFLSPYPQDDADFRDGYFQRIVSIDKFYNGEERTYLNVSLFGNLNKKIVRDGLKTQISYNIFLHCFSIFILFRKSSLVYIQSIYNAIYLIFYILFFDKFYVLDLHGVVPEELAMKNKKIHTKIASLVEKALFHKIQICIAVTNRMVKHYMNKYPNSKSHYIVYAILPNHINKTVKYNFEEQASEKIEIIYSGNAQVWQNIDLMLQVIKSNISNKINFTILTGEPDKINHKLKENGIDLSLIHVKSVKPEELKDYYLKSNYGFVLRDDILVNRVACPTKIIEYLAYGIHPIVLSEKIGDFEEYGYEYIFLNQLNDTLPVVKSMKNVEVIEKLFETNNFNLKDKILEIKYRKYSD